MKLTKKQAVDLSIELWTDLAETGKYKHEWAEWGKYGDIDCDCFLCEYDEKRGGKRDCLFCPYSKKFGYCYEVDTPYSKWDKAKTKATRKKYAGEFLAQLKELRNE